MCQQRNNGRSTHYIDRMKLMKSWFFVGRFLDEKKSEYDCWNCSCTLHWHGQTDSIQNSFVCVQQNFLLHPRLFLKTWNCSSHIRPIQYHTLFHNRDNILAMKFTCWWSSIPYRIRTQCYQRSQNSPRTQNVVITRIVITLRKQWVEVAPRRWSLQLKLSQLLSDSSLRRIWLVYFYPYILLCWR